MPETEVSKDYEYGYDGYYSYDYYYGHYYGYGYGYYDYTKDSEDDGWVLKITPGHIAGAAVITISLSMIIYGIVASN